MRVAAQLAEQRKGKRRPKESRGHSRVMTALRGSERPPKESGSHMIVGRDSWRPLFQSLYPPKPIDERIILIKKRRIK